ncbi:hypothetical protein N7499_006414 [Penicillium canescens]|uniref:Uncharacterized protein n=1 Tax=Penicillium canescens TaxID=5083 RepID=A0AAD6IDH8_PENCN|nr:uncharacterized protein N7446_002102 [Penicillium canescens]KAJ5997283.1 hypothetical protein N7522_008943 [Penicillium canescens]KAJ6043905.1 hypothetical protein N7460_005260 [Penicillium canescens]KAJ6055377.1 hypothetical protein N7444_004475 [Penicillium canescens]KAJ6074325.1 hypothetical protein N7446_002102 [Penicillium canescens]KAJ6081540.1 hypothetical protein N7499_006414 [Penicillium canescens]
MADGRAYNSIGLPSGVDDKNRRRYYRRCLRQVVANKIAADRAVGASSARNASPPDAAGANPHGRAIM